MGQPKLLLPWGQTTILGHLLRQWANAGAAQIALVRAADDHAIEHERLRAETASWSILNPSPERGMFSSIQCAAQWPGWEAGLTHWIVALGDQPHLQNETLRNLFQAVVTEPHAIWQPARSGRPRHPVILPKSAFERLCNSPHADLKAFLNATPEARRIVELTDQGLDLDIDTPDDYERAKRMAGLA